MRRSGWGRVGSGRTGSYFVKERLVEGGVLPLQFVDFFVELGFDLGTFDLQVLQGVNASLDNLG